MSKKNKKQRQLETQQRTETVNKKIPQLKEIPRLFTCLFEHQVSATTYKFEWSGPKISPQVWHQVLAFFKWTYDTTKSESQVRLYVNPQLGRWAAWAFPQKANTGMSATELDTDQTREQRQQFKTSDGWVYFGTVHHHCSSGAFQSGTDTNNEFNQDGIHITVGHMDRNQYDIHYRFYLGGLKLTDFQLEDIWQSTLNLSGVPVWMVSMIPKDAAALQARHEMGNPAPAGTEFPEVWRTNLIYEPPVQVIARPTMHVTPSGSWGHKLISERSRQNIKYDFRRALDRLNDFCEDPTNATTFEEALGHIRIMEQFDPTQLDIFDILVKSDVTPGQFMDRLEELAIEEEEKLKNGGDKQLNPPQQQQSLSGVGHPGYNPHDPETWYAQG